MNDTLNAAEVYTLKQHFRAAGCTITDIGATNFEVVGSDDFPLRSHVTVNPYYIEFATAIAAKAQGFLANRLSKVHAFLIHINLEAKLAKFTLEANKPNPKTGVWTILALFRLVTGAQGGNYDAAALNNLVLLWFQDIAELIKRDSPFQLCAMLQTTSKDAEPNKDQQAHSLAPHRPLPTGYSLIDIARQKQILDTAFNPPSEDQELNDVLEKLHEYFSTLGEFGSQERYEKGEDSDWWINEDGFSDWRSVGVDLLNPKLQTYEVIEGVRAILASFPERWMVFLYHHNIYDAKGRATSNEGEYCIWITLDEVEIFSTGRDEIRILLESFPLDPLDQS